MLHNMKFLYPLISTYICNCYAAPATQGDPTLMGAYARGILPILHFLIGFVLTNDLQTREVAFADDLTVAGKLAYVKNFWDKLATIGP